MDGDQVMPFPAQVDLGNIDRLRRDINDALEAGPARFVLDLDAVSFVDSLGVGLLVYARNRCEALETPLVLRNSPPMARRVLRLSALDTLFTFDPA